MLVLDPWLGHVCPFSDTSLNPSLLNKQQEDGNNNHIMHKKPPLQHEQRQAQVGRQICAPARIFQGATHLLIASAWGFLTTSCIMFWHLCQGMLDQGCYHAQVVITMINRNKVFHFSHCTGEDHILPTARLLCSPSLSPKESYLKKYVAAEWVQRKQTNKKRIKKGIGNSGNYNK